MNRKIIPRLACSEGSLKFEMSYFLSDTVVVVK